MPEEGALDPLLGRSILVTGAGGSIGKALSLRLTALGARRLVLLDSSEQAVYRLQNELTAAHSATMSDVVLGSVSDEALLDEVFSTRKVDLVFHAAAHKHVPLLETNPFAAIATNVFATQALVAAGQRYGAQTILLSTDKAVAPTSVLGATKQIAEHITLAAAGIVVRLTNVLGTEGSVAETFLRKIAAGEPLSIRHPEAARYFLTLEEAVDLLLMALYAVPSSSVLIPAIGQMHSVVSLATFLVQACGGASDLATSTDGLYPCEKLQELLCSAQEDAIAIRKDGYAFIVKQSMDATHDRRLMELQKAVTQRNLGSAIEGLQSLVPDYQPSATILALVDQSTAGASQS
jgi:FlaA1/EpsC-like NDP-sugar epimerase